MREFEIMMMTMKVLSYGDPLAGCALGAASDPGWGGILTSILRGWETEAQRGHCHAPEQTVDQNQNQNSKPGRFLQVHSAFRSRKVRQAVLGGGVGHSHSWLEICPELSFSPLDQGNTVEVATSMGCCVALGLASWGLSEWMKQGCFRGSWMICRKLERVSCLRTQPWEPGLGPAALLAL